MRTFRLEQTIAAPLQQVFDFHYNMQNHTQIHPLIYKIESLGSQTDTEGRDQEQFRFHETIRVWGFIPVRNIYTATRTLLQPNESYLFEVQSKPNVRMEVIYHFSDLGHGQTLLREETRVLSAGWGLIGYVARVAEKAHRTSLGKIKAILEGRT